MWIIHITLRLIAPYQHRLNVCINMTTIRINYFCIVPNTNVDLHIRIRLISPYQHRLTVCITMTTRRINSVSVVSDTYVDYPDNSKIDCTLSTQAECMYKYDNNHVKLCFCCS